MAKAGKNKESRRSGLCPEQHHTPTWEGDGSSVHGSGETQTCDGQDGRDSAGGELCFCQHRACKTGESQLGPSSGLIKKPGEMDTRTGFSFRFWIFTEHRDRQLGTDLAPATCVPRLLCLYPDMDQDSHTCLLPSESWGCSSPCATQGLCLGLLGSQ